MDKWDKAARDPIDGFCVPPCFRKLHMDDEALGILQEFLSEMKDNGDSGTMAGAVVLLRRVFLGTVPKKDTSHSL